MRELTDQGLSRPEVATRFAETAPTVRKWQRRCLTGVEVALADASARPAKSPRAIDAVKALLIVELRQLNQLQAQFAEAVGESESTASRVLARAGLSKLRAWRRASRCSGTSLPRRRTSCTSMLKSESVGQKSVQFHRLKQ